MKTNSRLRALAGASFIGAAAMLPSIASAHSLPGETGGLLHGLQHPLHGVDHIVAGIAVGIWAAQSGGRSRWLIPFCFVVVMALAGIAGAGGGMLSWMEQGIVGSLLLLGVLIAAAIRLPLAWGMTLVALFAVCHGYAHGVEMAADTSMTTYVAGLAIATALLHVAGIGAGVLLERATSRHAIRFAGAAVALCGVALWLA